jgi:hypothetical protein
MVQYKINSDLKGVKMATALKLNVNGVPIKTEDFVAGFIDHTVSGMIAALKNTGKIRHLEILIEGNDINVKLNGSVVSINTFATKIIIATLEGIVSTLKGVNRKIETLELVIKK